MTDNEYLFHQTPEQLAKDLINEVEFTEGDKVFEPFKGEGAFYNNLPQNVVKYWTEIKEGRDFRDFTENVDWVISNPPFRIDDTDGKRQNSIYTIIEHFSTRVNKGIAFLVNDYGLCTLTPTRLKKLNDNGIYIHKIVVCSVKKWRGRYFFIIFKKQYNDLYKFLEGNY